MLSSCGFPFHLGCSLPVLVERRQNNRVPTSVLRSCLRTIFASYFSALNLVSSSEM